MSNYKKLSGIRVILSRKAIKHQIRKGYGIGIQDIVPGSLIASSQAGTHSEHLGTLGLVHMAETLFRGKLQLYVVLIWKSPTSFPLLFPTNPNLAFLGGKNSALFHLCSPPPPEISLCSQCDQILFRFVLGRKVSLNFSLGKSSGISGIYSRWGQDGRCGS